MGCFAAIYHPVGIAMVVQGRVKNAMPLAVNRVFGNPKFTAAPLLTGAIRDLYDWKWAFIIPGVFSIAASIAYSFFLKASDRGFLYPTEAAASKGAARTGQGAPCAGSQGEQRSQVGRVGLPTS
ncbi:MAG: hypothetical protein QGH07_08910 [Alphaproteobacteria bacterium]|nr:hypothetical protein [Alphaproteobacteria bacterium]